MNKIIEFKPMSRVIEEEMKDLKKNIQQHFAPHGELRIKENRLMFFNNKTCGEDIVAVRFENGINVDYNLVYIELPFKREDIFPNVRRGCINNLEIKLFNIEEWKCSMAKRLGLFYQDNNVYLSEDVMANIIDSKNDCGYSYWHGDIFTDVNEEFPLDGYKYKYLKTREDCERFEEFIEPIVKVVQDSNKIKDFWVDNDKDN